MPKFNVTYEIVTEESAEYGDAEERGFIAESVSLREALTLVYNTRTNRVDCGDGAEASDSRMESARWIIVHNGMEYETGARESRSLHIPDSVTGSSRRRIARLFGL